MALPLRHHFLASCSRPINPFLTNGLSQCQLSFGRVHCHYKGHQEGFKKTKTKKHSFLDEHSLSNQNSTHRGLFCLPMSNKMKARLKQC